MFFKKERIRDEKHLKFLRELPCVVCGKIQTVAAHIRISTGGGTGIKPSDIFTTPLCQSCHTIQHARGERTFWGNRLTGAIELTKSLYANTGNREKCIRLIREYRDGND